jgi:hypothetical protein
LALLPRVAFALLAVATFAAFFVAQRLKGEPAVINKLTFTKFFSPNGDGARDVNEISFQLAEADDVTVDVVEEDGDRVRRLATARPGQPFNPVRVEWDGREDGGRRAPDGVYRLRIGLRRQGRSVVTPQKFHLDTRPPEPAVIRTSGPVVSPGQPVSLRFRGIGRRAVPRFRVLRTDVDPPEPVREFEGRAGSRRAVWDGLTDAGRPVDPGTYLIAVGAEDRAGNLGWGPRLPPVAGTIEGRPGITVRGLAVQVPVKPVRSGAPMTFRVDARRHSYRWSIRRVGEPRPRKRSRDRKTSTLLHIPHAPGGKSGLYLLEVRSGRYSTRVPFAVQSEERAPLLVVLPVMSWLGTDRLDDPRNPDGLPNTLLAGRPVPYPRPLVGDGGLPAGFADQVAPLLVMLDRARVPYDLTTDLALSLSRDPRATDRPGVLFAGSPRWVTRGLARRLRRYVADGGRVALMGTGSLRASVQIGERDLVRATPPGPLDALGGRIASVRRLEGEPPALTAMPDDPPDLPLFAGWDGEISGFSAFEELAGAGDRTEIAAGLGQPLTPEEISEAEAAGRLPREERPALTMVKQGQGLVIRVGLSEWVPRIAEGDAEVIQITRNVVDLLRRVNPRPRSAM